MSASTFPVTLTDTFEDDPAAISCESTPANAVWYEFTPTVTGLYTIDATNNTTTNAYGRVVVFDGTACNPYDTELVCAAPDDANVSTDVVLTANTTYLIAYTTNGNTYTMVDPTIIVSPSYTIGWCNLQWPQTLTANEFTTDTAYGRLYIAGLTDQTTGPDTVAAVIGEMGVGPDGSDPSSDPSQWTWFPATSNAAFVDNSNDEYMGDFDIPDGAGSPYDMAFRFSGNGGISWTYCDTADNSYDVSEAGDLTVTVPSLIISEYVEGSSNNKTLEFYNATGASIDLSTCRVDLFSNGSPTPSSTYTFPAVDLASGATYVVCHASSNTTLQTHCDELNSTPVNFNGDDALELWCDDGTLTMVDSFGQVGVDPGSSWGTAPTITENATLRRFGTLTYGDLDSSDAFDPANQYTGYPSDSFDGLGVHP